MELLPEEEFANALGLKKGLRKLANPLMKVLSLQRVNKLYSGVLGKTSDEFIDEVFKTLEIEFEIDEQQLSRIPKEGPFISISNHPYGAIDGLLLIKVLTKVRPDLKVMANFLLTKVEPISHMILSVNPFENQGPRALNYQGMKMAKKCLQEGNPLGIFPAGEVSSFQLPQISVKDKNWPNSVIKLIKNADVPVVPIYFSGNNSVMFHLMGLVHPSLRTLRLPKEIFNKKKRVVKIRIGNPINPKTIQSFDTITQLGRYLRAKTYFLGSSLEVNKFYDEDLSVEKQEPIAPPVETGLLVEDIAQIQGFKVREKGNYEVYLTTAKAIPNILPEIGRLREKTFREVGEGTNKSLDLDEYDLYYRHLFIWDKQEKQLIGAYRIGIGNEIMAQYGKRGFYVNTLFRLKKPLKKVLSESIELGRSFIIKEHQQKPFPLFILWQEIVKLLMTNDGYRYVLGPVSISKDFSSVSKKLMVAYLQKNFLHDQFARFVKPRKRFKKNLRKFDLDVLLDHNRNDIRSVDDLIEDIEKSGMRFPILFKQYLKCNARLLRFNLDPKFNDSLDGLMILDKFTLPEDMVKNFKRGDAE